MVIKLGEGKVLYGSTTPPAPRERRIRRIFFGTNADARSVLANPLVF